jgi:PKD repeat protein
VETRNKHIYLLAAIAAILIYLLPQPAAYAADPDLISRWRFDNDATDSVGTNNGTLTGTASYIANGRIDQAISFTSGAVIVPDNDSLDFVANEEFTISFWVNGGPQLSCMLLDKRDNTGYQFRYDRGVDLVRFMIYEGGGTVMVAAPITSVIDGSWHHVAGGRNASEVFLYVDGTLIGSAPDTTLADLTSNVTDLGIGNYPTGTTGDFTGLMDDVRVYGRALDQSEIAALASAPIGNQSPTPSFTANPVSGFVPLTVDFDGSASTDPDGSIVSYEWDFDSDNVMDATGVATSYTYNTPGSYTASLTVTDDQGADYKATATISVSSLPGTQYTIQATAGQNGTITPSGAIDINAGDNQSFTIAANSGYEILDVLVDGASVGAVPSYLFTNVQSDRTIDASFTQAPRPHSIRSDTLSLNGTWEAALGTGAEQGWTAAGQALLTWNTVDVPTFNLDTTGATIDNIQFVWARRDFTLTAQEAQRLAIIYWDHITFSPSVYINGQFIGYYEPMGPFQMIIPPGILQAGTNQIVMKVAGYAGLAKGASGYPLIPSGKVVAWNGSKEPGIREDIWIDFADTAYMKWLLAIPDLANSKVTMRVTPDALNNVNGLSLDVTVRTWPGGQLFSQASGPVADLVPISDRLGVGGTHSYLDVPMTGFQAWTHYTPDNLYSAEVQLKQGALVLDSVTIRFGMRETKNENGDYWLNGNRLWLRGKGAGISNFGRPTLYEINDYINTYYKAANVNAVRTHTQPPAKIIADAYDEAGMLVLPELPVVWSHHNFNFTQAEYDRFHDNCIRDAAGWISRLWNHPANIIWILSTESLYDNAWEQGPFRDFALTLDPTRSIILSGASVGGKVGSPDNYDAHSLGPAFPEGWEITGTAGYQAIAGPNCTITNSEYMNYGHRPWMWTGDDDNANISQSVLQLGSEITEGMRRNRLDSMLWYGTFSKVSAPYSFFSPILASLDLFDPSYETGVQVTTDLHIMNDGWIDSDLDVELFLTNVDPKFEHNAPTFNTPVAQWNYNFTAPADTVTIVPITWQTPLVPGNYWLTARSTGSGISGNPVMSQRFLHIVEPAAITASLAQKNFVILGTDQNATRFFNAKGLTTSTDTSSLDPNNDMVIIWNPANLTATEMQSAQALCNFADAGGHVVALSTASWSWPALCDVQIGSYAASRAFLYAGAQHPMLNGIQPEFFTRWNSVNRRGLVADNYLSGLSGANEIMWDYRTGAAQPTRTVVAEIPAASGSGVVLFSQLDIQNRLDNTTPEYDPVAERVLVNMLKMVDSGPPVIQYTINAVAGTGGTITPSGTITLNSGDNQSFTITPNANYNILDVLVDGVSQGAIGSYDFTREL